MEAKFKNGKVIIQNIQDFVPKHIFECGQCFRWDREADGSYTGVAYKRLINVDYDGMDVIISGSDIDDFENIWKDYFDLGRDYSYLKNKLSNVDDNLAKAVDFGYGIRLLNQPFEETLISYIISARNGIPQIKKTVNNIAEKYGDYIDTYKGRKYYSFPDMEKLSKAEKEELVECKAGFRAGYIKAAAEKIVSENISGKDFENKNCEETANKLLEFKGIGPKVASCIALFSLKKYAAFPVDVWINRIMRELYFKDEKLSLKKLGEKSEALFGEDAGFAQQYLFYYARENGIGRKKL